jgi:phytoene dehydrogenase-like protein
LENEHVSRVLVENGEAKGVVLASGRKIMARRFVVSSLDIKQSFQKFIDVDILPLEWKTALRNFRYESVTDLGIFMALREPTKYNERLRNWDPNIDSAFRVFIGFNRLDDLVNEEKEINYASYSQDVNSQRFQVLHPTKYDETQAPAGRHVSFIWDFVKCDANENQNMGEWDSLGPRMANLDKAQWNRFAPNMTEDNILDTFVYTPLDVQRNLINMIGGALQMRSVNMPSRALPSVETPIAHYYYCGAGTFPGGAITMSNGYIAANVIARIEGIKPWWVPVVWGREYPFLN